MRKVVDTVTFVPRVLKFETREKLALASNARFDPFSLRVSFLTSFSFFSRFRKREKQRRRSWSSLAGGGERDVSFRNFMNFSPDSTSGE